MTKDKWMNWIKKPVNWGKEFVVEHFSTPVKRKKTAREIGALGGTVLKYVLLFGLSFIILYPIIQQLAVAIRAPEDINNPAVLWIPEKFSLMNFKIAIILLDYRNAFIQSLLISTGAMILQILSTSLAGYTFARLRFKGSGILFAIVIFTIIVPQTTIELPLKLSLINFLGTGKSLLGKTYTLFLFAGLGVGLRSGVFIYLFRQFFRNIPVELEEAAYVDGANPLQVFYRVMLPNARGVIVTVAILAFVWQWNDSYFTSVFVTDVNSQLHTLTTKMLGVGQNIQSAINQSGAWQYFDQDVRDNPLFLSMISNTAGILTMLPLLIFYIFIQRLLFKEGLERTGIVG